MLQALLPIGKGRSVSLVTSDRNHLYNLAQPVIMLVIAASCAAILRAHPASQEISVIVLMATALVAMLSGCVCIRAWALRQEN